MTLFSQRRQQSISRAVRIDGFGLFHGQDVQLEFCPADPHHGIVFERVDLAQPVRIPALIDYVIPQQRCTVIASGDVSVSVTEHVMAALAGLQIDNCLIRINAPETPICDGSAAAFTEILLKAGVTRQDAPRPCLRLEELVVHCEDSRTGIAGQPPRQQEYEIGFLLDYGDAPLPCQSLRMPITPQTFLSELADARTFALEREVTQLRAAGLCQRATTENAVVFSEDGVLDNELRYSDEPVRHKILDCVGDFALLGCDLAGRFTATRSGHRLSHELIRRVRQSIPDQYLAEDAHGLSDDSLLAFRTPSSPSSRPTGVLKVG